MTSWLLRWRSNCIDSPFFTCNNAESSNASLNAWPRDAYMYMSIWVNEPGHNFIHKGVFSYKRRGGWLSQFRFWHRKGIQFTVVHKRNRSEQNKLKHLNTQLYLRNYSFERVRMATESRVIHFGIPLLFGMKPANDVYMRQYIRPLLVQIMACRLFGTKSSSEPMLAHC